MSKKEVRQARKWREEEKHYREPAESGIFYA
ncbi:hypothetical protein HMPREF9701_04971 [Delftia acidovorans CCUG 274B]|nr:hypothetical protein HMPREF9701_04971 [Delftia acidovorans CCUG 274B]